MVARNSVRLLPLNSPVRKAPGIPLLLLPKSIWHSMCLESIFRGSLPHRIRGTHDCNPLFWYRDLKQRLETWLRLGSTLIQLVECSRQPVPNHSIPRQRGLAVGKGMPAQYTGWHPFPQPWVSQTMDHTPSQQDIPSTIAPGTGCRWLRDPQSDNLKPSSCPFQHVKQGRQGHTRLSPMQHRKTRPPVQLPAASL